MKKKNPCRCCGGSGREADHARLGKKFRSMRIRHGLRLSDMARQCRVSVPHLSMLERGKRRWSQALVRRFRDGIIGRVK